jgi:hypothetical protein
LKPLKFHPAAAEEYLRATAYYAQINRRLAKRFHSEINRLIQDIKSSPNRFNQFEPPAQRHLSDVFPYAIIYLNEPDYIWVLAVMHLKRQPNYWQHRLNLKEP